MSPFGYKKLKAANWVIPNSNSDLDIQEITIPMSGRDRKVKQIYYKGEFIISFQCEYYAYVVNLDKDKAFELGLIANTNETYALDAIIDSLYYMYNPVSLEKSGGVIKVATIKALYRRLASDDMLLSTFTDKIIQCYKKHAFAKASSEGEEEGTIKFNMHVSKQLKDCGLWDRLRICVLSGRFHRANRIRERVLDNQTVGIYYDLDVTRYNLTLDGHYLLWPNQLIWNNTIYDVTEGTTHCPCCDTHVPTSAFNQETQECTKCESRHYQIHNYSTRVPSLLKFKATKVKPDTLYLGCELEFETTNREVARIKVGKALKDHAIMKSDGSIRHGFEVVTCPATLDIQLDVFRKFYADLPGELINAPNVGMHVHVSRKPLSILTLGKLTAFMNNRNNQKFIEYVAGRGNNGYCNMDTNRSVTYPWTHQNGGARYNTLNLCNPETIEFRIFSTPLSFKEFASRVQFCQALVDYCKPANLSLALKEVISYNNFINWVLPKRKDYPELVSTLKGFA